MSIETPRQTLYSVQRLRAIAAGAVLCTHSFTQLRGAEEYFNPDIGAFGVDIFFAISGFIMVYITAQREMSPVGFLRDRIIRIVPTYWFWTLVTAALAILLPMVFRTTEFDLQHLLLSLGFIVHENPTIPGSTSPLLRLGWTLNYEMYFYAIFAIAMAVNYSQRVWITIAALALIVGTGTLVQPDSPVAQFYTRSIMLEFALGMLAGHFFVRGVKFPGGKWLMLVSAILVIVFLQLTAHLATNSYWRGYFWALPAVWILLITLGTERAPGGVLDRAWLTVGEASYSLYLMHLFPLSACRIVWTRIGLPSEGLWANLAFAAVAIPVSVVASVIAYKLIEKPATQVVRGWLDRKRVARTTAA